MKLRGQTLERPGAVGTVSTDPVLLTKLGLVLVVPDHVLLQETSEVGQEDKDGGLTLSSCFPWAN